MCLDKAAHADLPEMPCSTCEFQNHRKAIEHDDIDAIGALLLAIFFPAKWKELNENKIPSS